MTLIKPIAMFLLIGISTILPAEEDTLPNATLWHALAPLGNEKQLKSEQLQQAFYEFGTLFKSMDAWRASYYLPHKAQPNWFNFREDIQEYSIKEFISLNRPYQTNSLDSASSSILFQGLWPNAQSNKTAAFDFSIINADSTEPHKLTDEAKFGELAGQLKLSEGSLTEDNTRVDLQATTALDSFMFTEMLESLESINMLFEQKHINRDHAESRIKHAAQQTNHNISHFSPFEQQIFANLYTSLPHTIRSLTSFSSFDKLAKPAFSPSGQAVTVVTYQQTIDLDAFSEVFPDTSDDFGYLLSSVSTHTEVLTQNDKKIGEFSYDANTQQISAHFALANGGFMLQNSNNELLDEIIYPTQLDTLEYKFITQAKASIFGLDFDVSNIEVQANYLAGLGQPRLNRTAKMDLTMASLPKIDVQGALLYFIPYWLIDLLIPGSLETLIIDAFEDVVTGNNGQGFMLNIAFKEQDNSHQIDVHADLEMPHELLQAILKVEEPEESEQPRLFQTLRFNLREDFAETVLPYKDPRLTDYLTQILD